MNFFGFGTRRNSQAPSPEPPVKFMAVGSARGTKSLELIRYNTETGKFELGEEALAVLKATRGPIGVVAVAGRARQGKSYILNQLLGRSGGFMVGPTHRPCTKGLWMWSAPVERTAPDGSRYSLVLLDTEGIDAYDQTGQYSTQIFSLAVLLSSLFVYNQMGGIDETSLDRLSLVTEMTKHIRVRASDGAAADASELASFTPSFLWLLRDFYLKLEEDGQQVSPRDYLEAALAPLPGSNEGVKAKNKIRESIKALFPDRDCFTLVRPVNSEEELTRLDSLDPSKLRPEFRDGLSRLARLVFNKAQPKRLGTQVLTGPVIAGLAEAYVSAINAGAVPTIATAWQGVAESESRRAADAAEAEYIKAFPSDVSAEDQALDAAHQRALIEAQHMFDSIAVGDENIRAANEKRWKESCNARFKELREKKLANAELAAERAINEGTARLQAVVRKEGATLEDLHREMMLFQQQYASSRDICGPLKYQRLSEFMRDVYAAAQKDLANKIHERGKMAQAVAEQRKQAAEEAQKQILARMNLAEKTVNELRSMIRQLESHVQDMESRLRASQQEAANKTQLLSDRERQVQELKNALRERDTAQASMAQQSHTAQEAMHGMQSQVSALQKQLQSLQHENERLRQQMQNERNTQVAQWHSEKARLEASLEAVAASKGSAETAASDARRRLEESDRQVRSLKSQMEGLNAEIQRLRAQVEATTPYGNGQGRPSDGFDIDSPMEAPVNQAGSSRRGLDVPDASQMSIAKIKDWMMEHGLEGKVWELAKNKAKKADYVQVMRSLAEGDLSGGI